LSRPPTIKFLFDSVDTINVPFEFSTQKGHNRGGGKANAQEELSKCLFVFQLLLALKQAGWKVKIHDSERLEPPHVTIYKKMRKWRLSLRDGTFLDKGDKWSQIDEAVKDAIQNQKNWKRLQREWNTIHEDNPVDDQEEGDDDPESEENG